MTVDQARLQAIVQQVLAEFQPPASDGQTASRLAPETTGREASRPAPEAAEPISGEGAFPDVDSAVAAAGQAYVRLNQLPLELRERMVAACRRAIEESAMVLARQAWQETGMGRYEDKVEKNLLNARKVPGVEDLRPLTWTGDRGLTLIERAPYGVIGSIAPSTNPTTTIISNAIGMVAAGNSVVFNAHPAAARCSALTVHVLNQAIQAVGGPANLLTCVAQPTIESAQALMRHKDIRLMVVTGGPAVVKEAMNSGKKAICAGPGNPPVVVDETADIEQAARDIVKGASFDNNIICIDEKEVFVVDTIADKLISALKAHGCVQINSWQLGRLMKVILAEDRGPGQHGVVNKGFVGRNASVLLKQIGVDADDKVRLVIAEVDNPRHSLVWTEQLMPVMPIARVRSVEEAIDLAIEAEHGFRHTAVMHSKDLDALSRMAREFAGSIFVKNGPALAGLGMGGEGYCSMSIASPTGEGVTSAKDFSRVRRCVLVDAFRIV